MGDNGGDLAVKEGGDDATFEEDDGAMEAARAAKFFSCRARCDDRIARYCLRWAILSVWVDREPASSCCNCIN